MTADAIPWCGRTAALVRPPIAKVAALAAERIQRGEDVIDLGQAILGLQPPASFLDGVRDYLRSPTPHVYSPDPGLPAVRDAVAAFTRDHKAIPCDAGQNVMMTCGANQAFADALFAVTHPGDEVITFGPGYFDHDYTLAMAGCRQVEVPIALHEGRYRFDLDAVDLAITPRTKCVVLVSPGNPTGAVADEFFVRALCERCARDGIWILSDETYDLLTFPPARHVSPASVAGFDRVAVLGTFSKLFAAAGWRIGYLAGSVRLIEEAFKVQDALVICAPVASQRGLLAALPSIDEYVSAARDELGLRRQALVEALAGWGAVELVVPEGATFGMAGLRDTKDDVGFCEDLLRRTGVVTVPGSAFGALGAGYARFSFGNQTVERIRMAGERMASGQPAAYAAKRACKD